MPSTPPLLSTTLAFFAGILLTIGFKDVYPDLQQRFQRHWRPSATVPAPGAASAGDIVDLRNGTQKAGRDGRRDESNGARGKDRQMGEGKRSRGIGEGIESTIGNTPLIRIKSLSEETGCEILGKAEVRIFRSC